VGLLAFSPLAAGLLSGKYQGDITPDGSRRSYVANLGGRICDTMWPALDAYMNIATKHDLNPAQMALAWAMTRPFMTSAIFGATNLDQLDVALGAVDVTLGAEVMEDIASTYRQFPMPF
jgi:aryl-alcohol dehydrogenase-like predicted oxidoreductase